MMDKRKKIGSAHTRLISYTWFFHVDILLTAICCLFFPRFYVDSSGQLSLLIVLFSMFMLATLITYIYALLFKLDYETAAVNLKWLPFAFFLIYIAMFSLLCNKLASSEPCKNNMSELVAAEQGYYQVYNTYGYNNLYLFLNEKLKRRISSDYDLEKWMSGTCYGEQLGIPWSLNQIQVENGGQIFKIYAFSKTKWSCNFGYYDESVVECVHWGESDIDKIINSPLGSKWRLYATLAVIMSLPGVIFLPIYTVSAGRSLMDLIYPPLR